MRLALFLSIVIALNPAVILAEEECTEQVYESADNQPDFNCPSPGELTLVPSLDPRPTMPISYGDEFVAPWDGAFVDTSRLIEIGLRVKALRRLRWLDAVRLSTESRLRLEHAESVLAVTREQFAARAEEYRRAIAEANDRNVKATAWYRSWVFGFLVGVVSAAIVSVLGIYLAVAL